METQLLERSVRTSSPDTQDSKHAHIPLQSQTTPNKTDLRNILLNEIRHLAIEQTGSTEFLRLTHDTLIVHPDSKKPITFRRNPDGTIETLYPEDIGLIQWEKAYDPFRSEWTSIESKYTKIIDELLAERFPISGHDYDELHTLVWNTMRRVLANTSSGYSTNPTAHGYSALHKLMGKENINRALRLAGSKATLIQFNFITRNTQACLQAHEQNPNATVLWMNNIVRPEYDPAYRLEDIAFRSEDPEPKADQKFRMERAVEEAHQGIDAGTIILQAQEICQGLQYDSVSQKEWEAFCSFNQRAVNHFPPYKDGPTFHTARLAAHAGITPTYSAIKAISKSSKHIRILPDATLTEFIRESGLRSKHRGRGTQAELANQLSLAINSLIQNYQEIPRNKNCSWSEWVKFLRIDRHPIQVAPKKSRPKPKSQQLQTDETNLKERVDSAVALTNLSDIPNGLLDLKTVPGVKLSLSINLKEQQQPVLTVTKLPTGALHISTDSYWTQGLNIPNPDQNQETHKGSTWTTRGTVTNIARRTGIALIKDTWKEHQEELGCMPKDPKIAAGLNRFWKNSPEHLRPWNIDRAISEELQEGLVRLVDQEIWDFAHSIHENVTLDRYNLAAAGREIIQELQETNPSVVEWLFALGRPTQEIKHPGQLITLAKENTQEHGIDPKHWKFISKISAETMRELTSEEKNPSVSATLLNAMGTVKAVPPLQTLQSILLLMWNQAEDSKKYGTITQIQRQNNSRVLELICKESSRYPQDNPEQKSITAKIHDLLDYAKAMAVENRPVNSKTYRGLVKKSTAWHHNMSAGPTRRQWIETLSRQQNMYQAWASAISAPFEDGEYTVRPLSNEKDLYVESLWMKHCVMGYGEQCSENKSRIFSVEKNGKKLATAEIQIQNHQWKQTQTRGPHNNYSQGEILDVIDRTAKAYQAEYEKAPARYKKKWKEEYVFDEAERQALMAQGIQSSTDMIEDQGPLNLPDQNEEWEIPESPKHDFLDTLKDIGNEYGFTAVQLDNQQTEPVSQRE